MRRAAAPQQMQPASRLSVPREVRQAPRPLLGSVSAPWRRLPCLLHRTGSVSEFRPICSQGNPRGWATRQRLGAQHPRPGAATRLLSHGGVATANDYIAVRMSARIDVAPELPLRGDPGPGAGDHRGRGLRVAGAAARRGGHADPAGQPGGRRGDPAAPPGEGGAADAALPARRGRGAPGGVPGPADRPQQRAAEDTPNTMRV